MAKALSQSSGCKVSGKKTVARSSGRKVSEEKKLMAELGGEMPKRLSKYGEWRLKNPNGMEGTYDLRAVMK